MDFFRIYSLYLNCIKAWFSTFSSLDSIEDKFRTLITIPQNIFSETDRVIKAIAPHYNGEMHKPEFIEMMVIKEFLSDGEREELFGTYDSSVRRSLTAREFNHTYIFQTLSEQTEVSLNRKSDYNMEYSYDDNEVQNFYNCLWGDAKNNGLADHIDAFLGVEHKKIVSSESLDIKSEYYRLAINLYCLTRKDYYKGGKLINIGTFLKKGSMENENLLIVGIKNTNGQLLYALQRIAFLAIDTKWALYTKQIVLNCYSELSTYVDVFQKRFRNSLTNESWDEYVVEQLKSLYESRKQYADCTCGESIFEKLWLKTLFYENIGRVTDFNRIYEQCSSIVVDTLDDKSRDLLEKYKFSLIPVGISEDELTDFIYGDEKTVIDMALICFGTTTINKEVRTKLEIGKKVFVSYLNYLEKHTNTDVTTVSLLMIALRTYFQLQMHSTYKFYRSEPSDYNKSLRAIAKGQSDNRDYQEILWYEIVQLSARIYSGWSHKSNQLYYNGIMLIGSIIEYVFEANSLAEMSARYETTIKNISEILPLFD